MRFAEILKRSRSAKKGKSVKIKAMRVLSLWFISVITVGTLLLYLPFSHKTDITFLDAIFTAVSATCVTGLSTVDTASTWTFFGQLVILVMIQTGGLGFMTFAVLISRMLRKMMTPKDRILIAMSYNLNSYGGIMPLIRNIFIETFVIEFLGAAILFTQFIKAFPLPEAIFRSFFTSVSAFCNAGFDLMGDISGFTDVTNVAYNSSMGFFATNPVVIITLIFLISIGGIGFAVYYNIKESIIHKQKISVYTKFTLVASACIFIGAALIFGVCEWNNQSTIGSFSNFQKILSSLFQSSTLRTAGFAAFDQANMTSGGQILSMICMFIGGCSGSTAGGVKVVTVGVIFLTVWCNVLGRKDALIFGRRISNESFTRATTVVFVQIAIIIFATAIIALTNPDLSGLSVLFETVSAISTVGLSSGIIPSLNLAAKIILMVLMYFGRVGILTVTYAMLIKQNSESSSITYPNADLLIG